MERYPYIGSHRCQTAGKAGESEVLDDYGIHSRILQGQKHVAGLAVFTVIDYGVQGGENPCPEPVRMYAKPPYVLHRITGSLPCSEFGTCYIHGIGTAVDCRNADVSRPGRSQQFKFPHQLHLRAVICCFAVWPYLGSFVIF